ncbi:macrophage mannose receptor 1-like [Gigantopelta aegis]|uniref:macrophage mannose receptor 1-like n=1 Tax=Gigantopelta aegis TaxID=1735272 RepID=UPI001B88D446|nr:macrophage mannose receptor 1-like [Gigantopelta aegis]
MSFPFSDGAIYTTSLGWRHFYSSDTGGCPVEDGFVLAADANLCFKVFTDQKDHLDILMSCYKLNATLIVLYTKKKNTAVSTYLQGKGTDDKYYIGFIRTTPPSYFKWRNGNAVNFTSWVYKGPIDPNGSSCVLLDPDTRGWHTITCKYVANYICEEEL